MDSLLPFVLGFLGGVIAAVIFVVAYKLGRGTRPAQVALRARAEADAGTLPVVDAPPNRDAVTPVLMRYLDAERDTWEGARRLVLSASAGGLAISFLVFNIQGARQLDVFPVLWITLVVALFLGLLSYGWQALGLRIAVLMLARVPSDVPPVMHPSPVPWPFVLVRVFIAASAVAVSLAFVLIVAAGFSLRI